MPIGTGSGERNIVRLVTGGHVEAPWVHGAQVSSCGGGKGVPVAWVYVDIHGTVRPVSLRSVRSPAAVAKHQKRQRADNYNPKVFHVLLPPDVYDDDTAGAVVLRALEEALVFLAGTGCHPACLGDAHVRGCVGAGGLRLVPPPVEPKRRRRPDCRLARWDVPIETDRDGWIVLRVSAEGPEAAKAVAIDKAYTSYDVAFVLGTGEAVPVPDDDATTAKRDLLG